jgi:DNA invertase Pin-like site-specific DNA recombinase
MRDLARQRGWNIVVEVEDIGSGAALLQKRDELLAAARRRDIDLVVVWRLERWGRSLADLVSTKELVSFEVGFVSVREAFELTPLIGRALAGVLAAIPEFEGERVKAGIARAEKRARRSSNKINPTRGSKDTRTKTSVKR